MAKQTVNIGVSANDGTGDQLRDAFDKLNDNFDEVYLAGPVGTNLSIGSNTLSSTDTNGDIILAPNGTGVVATTKDLTVDGNTTLDGTVNVSSTLVVNGTSTLQAITGNGLATLSSLTVGTNAQVNGNLTVQTNAQVDGTLNVDSTTTLNGLTDNGSSVLDSVDVTNDLTVGTTLAVGTTATVTGLATFNGGITCDGGVFTVANTSGNTTISGTLSVDSVTDLNANTNITGVLDITGTIDVSGQATVGSLDVNGAAVIDTTLDVTGDTTLSDATISDVTFASGALQRATSNQNMTLSSNGNGAVILSGRVRMTTSAPVGADGSSGDLVGDIAFNSNHIYYCTADYDGSTQIWKSIDLRDFQSTFASVVDDSTPALGGALDVNGNQIVSSTNGDIIIAPHGTGSLSLEGSVVVDGTLQAITTAPTTSVGAVGDLAGHVAFDSDYIYYCTADYDGATQIWKRVAIATW